MCKGVEMTSGVHHANWNINKPINTGFSKVRAECVTEVMQMQEKQASEAGTS